MRVGVIAAGWSAKRRGSAVRARSPGTDADLAPTRAGGALGRGRLRTQLSRNP
jgi:hypothetical protein